MIVAFLAMGALLYGWGLIRVARLARRFPARAVVYYAIGLVSTGAALLGPLGVLSDRSLAWHMVQHLILMSLAAPLILLGAPFRLALASMPGRAAAMLVRILASGPMRTISHPAFAWLQFAFVLYGVHFSPLYQASLENEWIHAFEHTIFLVSAIIFWTPVLAVSPAPHAPPHPVRLLSVFLALPMSAFLGFAFYVTHRVMYAHYAGRPYALDDQMNAGAVMWVAGGGPLFIAFLCIVADWAARDRRTPEPVAS